MLVLLVFLWVLNIFLAVTTAAIVTVATIVSLWQTCQTRPTIPSLLPQTSAPTSTATEIHTQNGDGQQTPAIMGLNSENGAGKCQKKRKPEHQECHSRNEKGAFQKNLFGGYALASSDDCTLCHKRSLNAVPRTAAAALCAPTHQVPRTPNLNESRNRRNRLVCDCAVSKTGRPHRTTFLACNDHQAMSTVANNGSPDFPEVAHVNCASVKDPTVQASVVVD